MKYKKTLTAAALTGLMSIVPVAFAQQDARGSDRISDESDVARAHDGIRLRCGSTGMQQISLHTQYARYRNRGIGFRATFEAESNHVFQSGDMLDVFLAGIPVGTMTLAQLDTGEVAGRIFLRYQPDADPQLNDVDLHRIVVRQGSSVVVGPLGCALQS
ncbi:MAG: hypothetical protein HKN19_19095 [Halioglobus sp.]|nr:hypothetical protein [Halioglobus sp.]